MAHFNEFIASKMENAVGGTTELMTNKKIRNVDRDEGWITIYFEGENEEDSYYLVISDVEFKSIFDFLLRNAYDQGYSQATRDNK